MKAVIVGAIATGMILIFFPRNEAMGFYHLQWLETIEIVAIDDVDFYGDVFPVIIRTWPNPDKFHGSIDSTDDLGPALPFTAWATIEPPLKRTDLAPGRGYYAYELITRQECLTNLRAFDYPTWKIVMSADIHRLRGETLGRAGNDELCCGSCGEHGGVGIRKWDITENDLSCEDRLLMAKSGARNITPCEPR